MVTRNEQAAVAVAFEMSNTVGPHETAFALCACNRRFRQYNNSSKENVTYIPLIWTGDRRDASPLMLLTRTILWARFWSDFRDHEVFPVNRHHIHTHPQTILLHAMRSYEIDVCFFCTQRHWALSHLMIFSDKNRTIFIHKWLIVN